MSHEGQFITNTQSMQKRSISLVMRWVRACMQTKHAAPPSSSFLFPFDRSIDRLISQPKKPWCFFSPPSTGVVVVVVSAVVAPVTPCLRSKRCSRRRLCLSFPSSLSDSELLLELDDPPSCIVPRLKFVSIRSKWHPHISGNPSACPVETMFPGNRERHRKVSKLSIAFPFQSLNGTASSQAHTDYPPCLDG